MCLRAHVPTCLACLCAHVPTCFACLRAHVPSCLASLRAHVPTCLACLRPQVPTCVACLSVQVPICLAVYLLMCKPFILNNVNSYIIQNCYLYSGLKIGNVDETLVSLLEIFMSSGVAFRSLGGLKMFWKKNLGKCIMYIGIAVMPRLCCPVFHFHQF